MSEQLSPDQARARVLEGIKVTSEDIVSAKEIILKTIKESPHPGAGSSENLVKAVLKAKGATFPREVRLHPTLDPLSQVRQLAETLSVLMAAVEAILSMVHDGTLLPMSESGPIRTPSIRYDMAPLNSGSQSGTLDFRTLDVHLPSQLRLAFSRAS
jgi:hypothetical protein